MSLGVWQHTWSLRRYETQRPRLAVVICIRGILWTERLNHIFSTSVSDIMQQRKFILPKVINVFRSLLLCQWYLGQPIARSQLWPREDLDLFVFQIVESYQIFLVRCMIIVTIILLPILEVITVGMGISSSWAVVELLLLVNWLMLLLYGNWDFII